MAEHQGKKLQSYLRDTRKPMESIAAELGISRTTLYGHFKGDKIDQDFLQLLKEKGYNFQPSAVSEGIAMYGPLKGNNITYVPLFAYGGFLHGYANKVFMDTLEKFSLPGIHGEHFAFEVQGSSMAPYANPGDIVISRKEERLEYMIKGRAYVLQTVDGIIIKYFEKITDGKAHFKSNASDGGSPIIPLKEIKVVYQVIKVLSDFKS